VYWVLANDHISAARGCWRVVFPQMMLAAEIRADSVRAPVANEDCRRSSPVAQVSHYGHLVRLRDFVTNGIGWSGIARNYASASMFSGLHSNPFLGQWGGGGDYS